jgi:hypothetical protein
LPDQVLRCCASAARKESTVRAGLRDLVLRMKDDGVPEVERLLQRFRAGEDVLPRLVP